MGGSGTGLGVLELDAEALAQLLLHRVDAQRRIVYFQRAWRRSLRSPFSFWRMTMPLIASTTCSRRTRPR